MEIENITGHNIRIYKKDGSRIDVPPIMGKRLQLIQKIKNVGEINGIPVIEQSYGVDEDVLKFFAPKKNGDNKKIYIVSSLVAQYIKRDDFYVVAQKVNGPDRKTVIGASSICKNPYL